MPTGSGVWAARNIAPSARNVNHIPAALSHEEAMLSESRRRHEVICAHRRRLSRVAARWKRDVQAIEAIHEWAVNLVLRVMRRCSFGAGHQLKVALFAPMLLQQSVDILRGSRPVYCWAV